MVAVVQNKISELKSVHLAELRSIINRTGITENTQRIALLNKFRNFNIRSTKVFRDYHDILLLLCAYPGDEKFLALVESELERISQLTYSIMHSSNEGKKSELGLSGMHHTHLFASFSLELVEWLLEKYPKHVTLYSCDVKDFKPQEIFRFGLLPAEYILYDKKETGWKEWNKIAFGNLRSEQLRKIIQAMKQLDASLEIQDFLFDAVKLFSSLQLEPKKLSRTFGRAPAGKLHFHSSPLVREIQLAKLMSENLPAPLKLTSLQKQEYVDVARTSLMLYCRETDPVTFANSDVVEVYDMGRGISIALYTMRSERRQSLDSYVGYMAFRNRLPCAYGGGWIFRNKSRIGINVFPPFRGGESTLLFGRILQLYKQRFDLSVFEAEPYQIGKNNAEGIQSGAFWFYYRLGFRPRQENLFSLAEEERKLIVADKKYRTSRLTLTHLAESILELNVIAPGRRMKQPGADTSYLSRIITEEIVNHYSGERGLARNKMEKKAKDILSIKNLKGWSDLEKKWFSQLAPVIALIPKSKSLTIKEKANLIKWICSRTHNSEEPYILMTKTLEKIWKRFDKELKNA